MNREHANVMRVIPLMIIGASTILLSCVLGLMKEIYWDHALCVAFVDMLFLLVFFYELEYERKNGGIYHHIATTFSRVAGGYAACCLLGLLFLVCPQFFTPVSVFPIILGAVGNEFLGITTGMFLVVQYALIFEASSYEVISYMFLVILSGGLAKSLVKKTYRRYLSILLFCANLIVPLVFYYLWCHGYEWINFAYAAAGGAITAFCSLIVFPFLQSDSERAKKNHFIDITSEDYSEVIRVKKHFPDKYMHGLKVSEIAGHIAANLGFSVEFCQAAGFYYRIGTWDVPESAESGAERAEMLNFPHELITLLSEYNGENAKPSTPESAIIHMIDALTVYLDALAPEDAKNSWNREMLIYQTLNEFSASGLYDASGLSMNQFLNVRTFLVKEKLLQ